MQLLHAVLELELGIGLRALQDADSQELLPRISQSSDRNRARVRCDSLASHSQSCGTSEAATLKPKRMMRSRLF